MRSFEQYDEICKYFAEGKQRDNDANAIQKHLQLYNLSLGEYLVNRYALWLDFRMIDENELYGTGRRIENVYERTTHCTVCSSNRSRKNSFSIEPA